MVWGLFSLDSLPGAQNYYIFSRGTYKIGRKGCDVIVPTDKGVSRHHADLVLDAMISQGTLHDISASFPSDVRIIDHSKYGTYINKDAGTKSVREMENNETTLKNGDLVSFGNAIFRFCYVPLIFFIHCSTLQVNLSLKGIISSIGACTTHNWNEGCTHVLADESSPVTEDIINAIVEQKPVVHIDWVKVLAEKTICAEIPSCNHYVPNLTLEGISVKIVEPKVRENCLVGHTFLLGESHLYKFGDKLQSLLNMCSAKVLPADEFCPSTQTLEAGEKNPVVLVIPEGAVNEFNRFHHLGSLSRVNDIKLVAAILSGHLDPSVMESPSIHISSSQSTTDETIVADSEVEMDTAISSRVARSEETTNYVEKKEMPSDRVDITTDNRLSSFQIEDGCIVERRDKCDKSDTSGHQNSDIIYSQMIVRDTATLSLVQFTSKENVVNFKRFRKRETRSGNSFKDLIPFSKDPYKESDRESEEAEYMREEKKRKQMEAIAEDLFRSDKVKRRGAAGTSLSGLLARG
ncbi:nijmegen breakage syndrome 1 [Tasmannia lanceolata]|uniref:nijmegen breakage syndrome 1 n=1 Tax=Tasmannia lanceolata TaxID=3420 RepID=UPI004063C6BB